MDTTLHFAIEAHVSAATLYLRGPLSAAGALRAARACEQLPAPVRALRADVRGVSLYDPSALDALALLIARWHETRRGTTGPGVPAVTRPLHNRA